MTALKICDWIIWFLSIKLDPLFVIIFLSNLAKSNNSAQIIFNSCYRYDSKKMFTNKHFVMKKIDTSTRQISSNIFNYVFMENLNNTWLVMNYPLLYFYSFNVIVVYWGQTVVGGAKSGVKGRRQSVRLP